MLLQHYRHSLIVSIGGAEIFCLSLPRNEKALLISGFSLLFTVRFCVESCIWPCAFDFA